MYSVKKLKLLPRLLTKNENKLITVLLFVICAALITVAINWYFANAKIVPAQGGEYIEGIIGAPRLINPLLSQGNEVDQDITRLLFSGLLKQENSELKPDLARSYTISPDNLIYTFVLRDDVYWHDGTPFSANDVIFTLQSIQNPEFKSPLFNMLMGVKATKVNDLEISLTLPGPFAPFASLMSFGILPQHIWEDIPLETAHLADFNVKKPIGTGPFMIKSFKKDSRGVIKSYTLIRNERFYNNPPYLETITVKFYPNYKEAVDALNNKNIDGINYLPNRYYTAIAQKNNSIYSLFLPQYTALFFNKNNNELLSQHDIRLALAKAIDKNTLIAQTLDNQGSAIHGPILPGFAGYDPTLIEPTFNKEEAIATLEKNKWSRITKDEFLKLTQTQPSDITTHNEEIIRQQETTQTFFWKKDDKILSLNLTTVDNPETQAVAEYVKKSWEEVGIDTRLTIIPKEQLLSSIIKPRNYEALLIGQIIGNDPDLYAFWHSSQAESPGVNLSLYQNEKADILLEEARKTSNQKEREKKYGEFQNILQEDLPAIFLYTPTYSYVVSNTIKGITIQKITIPADRFAGIEQWYIKTKRDFTLR